VETAVAIVQETRKRGGRGKWGGPVGIQPGEYVRKPPGTVAQRICGRLLAQRLPEAMFLHAVKGGKYSIEVKSSKVCRKIQLRFEGKGVVPVAHLSTVGKKRREKNISRRRGKSPHQSRAKRHGSCTASQGRRGPNFIAHRGFRGECGHSVSRTATRHGKAVVRVTSTKRKTAGKTAGRPETSPALLLCQDRLYGG